MEYKEEILSEINLSHQMRVKELEGFFLFLKGLSDSPIKESLNKSFILLLYANWEGFIKESTIKYFEFILSQKCTINDITDNFYLIHLKTILRSYKLTKNILVEEKLLKDIQNKNRKFKIKNLKDDSFFNEYILGHENNLKQKNYINICKIINYNFTDPTKKFEVILNKLVHNRNSIAHTGIKANENYYAGVEDINDMKIAILSEMKNFLQFLENNINKNEYLTSMHTT